jgi:hypothetical protein
MIIREPRPLDKAEIDRIYNRFFSENEYPDFFNKDIFPCPFVVTEEDGTLILAGGVRLIAEAVVVSDQDVPKRTRFDALLQALGSTIFIAQGMQHKQIYVFVNNDEKYVKTLQRFGFKTIDAKLLVLDFGDSHGKAKAADSTSTRASANNDG